MSFDVHKVASHPLDVEHDTYIFSLLEYAFVLSINQFNSSMNSFDLTIRALSLFSTMFCKPLMEINLVINLGLDFLLQN